ncbi:hypothetical protein C7T94_08790 [Pedobacter yulinensis]|uniref:Uncharacterized protein n=1 Tax=Pedobacter yulinensis TaxID=2126353 RepID=A0A2T3HJU7_9SPHI|nr:hypothetical protein [Pedobacter yulinensis]PST82738.1 hypothetical protein C7T94_08790 [Pedobacter yulinensis]
MDPVSSFTATAIDALESAKPILEKSHAAFQFRIYLADDSLWLTSGQGKTGNMAFRLAFSGGSTFALEEQKEEGGELRFRLISSSGEFEVTVLFPVPQDAIFHYTTTFKPALPMLVPFWPKDMLPLGGSGKPQQAGKVHADQVGTRSGVIYLSMTRPKAGSVFYFQNLTALGAYCEATKTAAAGLVGGKWPELGFSLPLTTEEPLPANEKFVISDAFVRLSPDIPASDIEITTGYLNNLAALYPLLPKPEVKYHEWRDIAEKGLEGLANHKGCWMFADGHPYLNAYLSDYKNPPEIMVQLAVLLPLLEFCAWRGEQHSIAAELRDGLPRFYDEELGTVVRWLPALEDNLDKSEEQKQERVMDSWYLYHPLMNLTRLADRGDKEARKLLAKSVDYAIKVARHFNYEWPVFYRMDTFEVIKAETEPGMGGEKDVPGSFAKLMLEVWQFTGEDRFLAEAKKSVKRLKGLGFDLFYQANNTAFSAVALLRLYKQTKDEWYLDMSYVCIASILKNVQLWDCDYGYGKYFPSYFSIFPLRDAPYAAAYEEQEVYSTLHGYLQESADVEILPSVRLLVAELVRYAITRMPFYFPPMLPQEMFSDTVKTGEIDPNLWIPLEDIQDGWNKSGEVGQEVYGACISFGIVPRQYFKSPKGDYTVFIDYPVADVRFGKNNAFSLRALGEERGTCRLIVFFKDKGARKALAMASNGRGKAQPLEPTLAEGSRLEYQIQGDSKFKMSW